MTYKNRNPESPKGKCFIAFQTGGPDAAHAMAKKLAKEKFPGAEKAPDKVERWLREWGVGDMPPAPEKPVSEPRKASVPALKDSEVAKAAFAGTKRRVYDVGEPNVYGTVLTAGEQVSVVRWDVPLPWGKETNTPNDKLKDVENEPSATCMKVFRNAASFRVVKKNGAVKKSPKGVTYRDDRIIGEHKTLKAAVKDGVDEGLWVFAMTKGGTVALLQRAHWAQYLALEETKP